MNFNRNTQQLEQNKIDFKFFQLTAVESFTHKTEKVFHRKHKNEKVLHGVLLLLLLLLLN